MVLPFGLVLSCFEDAAVLKSSLCEVFHPGCSFYGLVAMWLLISPYILHADSVPLWCTLLDMTTPVAAEPSRFIFCYVPYWVASLPAAVFIFSRWGLSPLHHVMLTILILSTFCWKVYS